MKLIKPGDRPVIRRETQARRKTPVPVSTWRYMRLACGHNTTSDVAALYAAFRVKPDTYFCEQCQEWSATLDITPLPAQDAEPPF